MDKAIFGFHADLINSAYNPNVYLGGKSIAYLGDTNGGKIITADSYSQWRFNFCDGIALPYDDEEPDENTPGYGLPGAVYF